jgi:predicted phage tail protein
MPDEINVQPDAVSTETESTTEATKEAEVKQPSQEEIIGTLLAKALETELPKHLSKVVDPLKRELQSTKDKSVAEVTRAQRQAEQILQSIQSVVGDDPDLQLKLQNAGLRAQAQLRQQAEYEDMTRRQQAEFDKNFKAIFTDMASSIGLDPNQVDWADDEGNYLNKAHRIKESVKAKYPSIIQAIEAKYKKEYETKLANALKEAGINSVDTSMPVGNYEGIPTDRKALERYIDGLSIEEYQKQEPKITAALKAGRIK